MLLKRKHPWGVIACLMDANTQTDPQSENKENIHPFQTPPKPQPLRKRKSTDAPEDAPEGVRRADHRAEARTPPTPPRVAQAGPAGQAGQGLANNFFLRALTQLPALPNND